MNRMGHDSMRAALVYQHNTRGADEAIAAAVGAQVRATREQTGAATDVSDPESESTEELDRSGLAETG